MLHVVVVQKMGHALCDVVKELQGERRRDEVSRQQKSAQKKRSSVLSLYRGCIDCKKQEKREEKHFHLANLRAIS